MSKEKSPANKFCNKYIIYNVVILISIFFYRNVSLELSVLILIFILVGGTFALVYVCNEITKLECKNSDLEKQIEHLNNKLL